MGEGGKSAEREKKEAWEKREREKERKGKREIGETEQRKRTEGVRKGKRQKQETEGDIENERKGELKQNGFEREIGSAGKKRVASNPLLRYWLKARRKEGSNQQ